MPVFLFDPCFMSMAPMGLKVTFERISIKRIKINGYLYKGHEPQNVQK
jgi:hypothetical protein